MSEVIMSWPWYDRAIIGAIIGGAGLGIPILLYSISKTIDQISGQQERIIRLLADIRYNSDGKNHF